MAKLFPETVTIKKHKCPACKEGMEWPIFDQAAAVVRALCNKPDCGYALDLCWVGDLQASSN